MARVSDATVDEHRQSENQKDYSGKLHHWILCSKWMLAPVLQALAQAKFHEDFSGLEKRTTPHWN
jgi:hypothetical protein